MKDFTKIKTRINRLISEYGENITLNSIKTKALATTVKVEDKDDYGSPLTTSKRVYYIPSNTLKNSPTIGDDLIFDKHTQTISAVKEYKLGTTLFAYQVEVME